MEKKKEANSLSKLSPSFLSELVAFSLTDKGVLDICKENIKYSFLESEHHKRIFQFIFDFYDVEGKIPTIGVISQGLKSDNQVLKFLGDVKRSQEILTKENRDALISQLETFIKRSKFVQLYNKTHELFQGGKEFEAISVMAQESVKIEEFALSGKQYQRIFKDYAERHSQRIEDAGKGELHFRKILSGIAELDEITGGFKKGTSVLFMASSGKGKTTALRWLGITAARTGHIVVHFQGEGTESECLEGYDAAWTGTKLSSFNSYQYAEDTGYITDKTVKAVDHITKVLGGDIIVHGEQSFDKITLERCREIIRSVEKEYGRVDMLIFDYLEIFQNNKNYSTGEQGERKRREDIANGITNLATEFNAVSVTATQSQDISPQLYNNPDFVMTRNHASEFKGVVKPFSYFLTINMTDDEYDEDIARLYADKFRGHKSGQTITIAQKKDIGRFYDDARTRSEGLYVKRL